MRHSHNEDKKMKQKDIKKIPSRFEKSFFVELDDNRIKIISALDEEDAKQKASEEYEGAKVTLITQAE